MGRLLFIGLLVLFFVVSSTSTPRVVPVSHYNVMLATVATVGAYESLVTSAEPVVELVTSAESVTAEESAGLSDEVRVVWDAINVERVRRRLPPFELSVELVGVAAVYKWGSNLRNCRVIRAVSVQSPLKLWLNSFRARRILLVNREVEAGLAFNGKTWYLVVRDLKSK
jgi:hypothetical protein